MEIGTVEYAWWRRDHHLNEMFGPRYAVVGSALGVSDANGIIQPEAGTLEAKLTAVRGRRVSFQLAKARGFQHRQSQLFRFAQADKNPTYFALTPQSFTDFDWAGSPGFNGIQPRWSAAA